MGVIRTKNNGHYEYSSTIGFIHLSELDGLRTDLTIGSIVHVIETGEKYILDDNKVWCPLNTGNGGSGGSSGLTWKVVDELPQTGEPNVIYMVENGDSYKYYMYEGNTYVEINNPIPTEGLVTVDDLADYVKKTDLTDGSLSDITVTNKISAKEFIEDGVSLKDKYFKKDATLLTVNEFHANNTYITNTTETKNIKAETGEIDDLTVNNLTVNSEVTGFQNNWKISSNGDAYFDNVTIKDADGLTIGGKTFKQLVEKYQKQSDWKQTNNELPDYIKNKPSTPGGGGGELDDVFWIGTKEEYEAEKDTITAGTHVLITNDVSGGSGGSAELTAELIASIAVGGVDVGTTYSVGTPLENIIRAMLSPVLYPTLTAPKATLSAIGSRLFEKGSSHNVDFTLAFSRGSINPAYGTSGYRSGTAVDYTFEGTTKTTGSFNITVSEAKTSFVGSVRYNEGEQPKDSTGNNYSTPLPAGSVNSNTVTFEFVDAMWGNTDSITEINKLPLVSKTAGEYVFEFPPATESDPETFDIPASWNVTGIFAYNEITKEWSDCSDTFTKTTTTHENAASEIVNYDRYTCNLGYEMGARGIKVTWTI